MYSELLNCIYLHLAHSLSYSIYPTILHYLSDHNYIIPLIKPRFFCSNYDWSISLASKWFNHTTCPFTIYLPPFVSIIFSPFFFFSFLSNYDRFTTFLSFSLSDHSHANSLLEPSHFTTLIIFSIIIESKFLRNFSYVHE